MNKIVIEHIRRMKKSFKGYFKLSDGSKTSFNIDLEYGWQQWGNVRDNLSLSVHRLEELQQELWNNQ